MSRVKYGLPRAWPCTSSTSDWCGDPPSSNSNWAAVPARSRGPSASSVVRGRRRTSASQRCSGCRSPTSPDRRVATTASRRDDGPAITYMIASSVERSAHCRSSITNTTCRSAHRRSSQASNPSTNSPSFAVTSGKSSPASATRAQRRSDRQERDRHRGQRQARAGQHRRRPIAVGTGPGHEGGLADARDRPATTQCLRHPRRRSGRGGRLMIAELTPASDEHRRGRLGWRGHGPSLAPAARKVRGFERESQGVRPIRRRAGDAIVDPSDRSRRRKHHEHRTYASASSAVIAALALTLVGCSAGASEDAETVRTVEKERCRQHGGVQRRRVDPRASTRGRLQQTPRRRQHEPASSTTRNAAARIDDSSARWPGGDPARSSSSERQQRVDPDREEEQREVRDRAVEHAHRRDLLVADREVVEAVGLVDEPHARHDARRSSTAGPCPRPG